MRGTRKGLTAARREANLKRKAARTRKGTTGLTGTRGGKHPLRTPASSALRIRRAAPPSLNAYLTPPCVATAGFTQSGTRIVEFVDPAFGLSLDSKVPVSEPLFQATPSEVNINDYNDFGTYKFKIHLRNRDKVARRVKICRLNSLYFSISTKKDVQKKVAPMMEIVYTLTFKPKKKREYNVDLVVVTEREKFVIPVRAGGERPMLEAPREVAFGSRPVYIESKETFLLRNQGPKATSFQFEVTPPYSVSPVSGHLAVGDATQVCVSFKPPKELKFTGELVAHLSDNEVVPIRLTGVGCELDVSVSESQITTPTTYIYLKSQKAIEIRNKSQFPVHFEWKNELSRDAEYERRQKALLELDRKEQKDLDAVEPEPHSENDGESSDEEYGVLKAQQAIAKRYEKLRADVLRKASYSNENFTIEPLEGDIFPGGVRVVTFTFVPDNSVEFVSTAALDVSGLVSRMPVTVRGRGLGPEAKFLFNQLDIGEVYINAVHNYSVELENVGKVPVEYSFEFEPGSRLTCSPDKGRLALMRDAEQITFTFTSTRKGPFEETVKCWLKGNQTPLDFTFRGTVIGPTFYFEEKELHWGNVSYGFLNKREVTIVNTSEIPIRCRLRVPEDEKFVHSEFKMVPPESQILPSASGKVRIEFVPQSKKKYTGYRLAIDIDGVGSNLKSIPMTAACLVPTFRPELDVLDYGDVFLQHPYRKVIPLANENELPGRFEVKDQGEHTFSMGRVKPEKNAGSVPASATLELGFWFTGIKLGPVSIPIEMSVPGSQMTVKIELKANVIGPRVVLSKKRVVWKGIPVLKPDTQEIVLDNQSLIKAPFKVYIYKKKSCFRNDVIEGIIDPQKKQTIRVTARLNDFDTKIRDKLMIIVEDGDTISVPLSATGVGSTVVPTSEIKSVDMGHVFTVDKATHEFVLENRGRRAQSLTWAIELPAEGDGKKKGDGGKKKGGKKGGADEEGEAKIKTTYRIIPESIHLKPNTAMKFKVVGKHARPGVVTERWVCHSTVAGGNKSRPILTTDLKAQFVVPLLEFSEKSLDFLQRCEPKKEVKPDKKLLSLKNLSTLPLVFWAKCPPPFSIDRLEYELAPGESATTNVLFSANLGEDKQSLKFKTNLVVSYRDHTQKDRLPLRGEVCFPNLAFSKQQIDFGCVLNETTKQVRIQVTNISKVDAYYQWSLVAEDDAMNIIAEDDDQKVDEARGNHPPNEVFDVSPIRGMLGPGESEFVDFLYYGHMNAFHQSIALCEVLGGPEYEVQLQGEASSMLYTIDKTELDFGDNELGYKKSELIVVQNVGRVPFNFEIDTSKFHHPVFTVSPRSGLVRVGKKLRLTVRYEAKIPDVIRETFYIRVAYFEPIPIVLNARGLFPQVSLNLARSTLVDPEYKYRLAYAADSMILGMDGGQVVATETPISRAQTDAKADKKGKGGRRNMTPIDISLEQRVVAEADRLLYFDHCRAIATAPAPRGRGKKRRAQDPRDLVLSNYVIDFGHVILGSQKKIRFRVTNPGVVGALVDFKKKEFESSMFDIVGPTPVGLPPENQYRLTAVCAPRPDQDAPGTASMTVQLLLKKAPRISVVLKASVELPSVSLSTRQLDFGEVYEGMRSVRFLQVRNPNPVPADWSVKVGSRAFRCSPQSGKLAPGGLVTLRVAFTPTKKKRYSGSVVVSVKMSDRTQSIKCVGQGIIREIRIEPSALRLKPVFPYQTSEPRVVTIHNPTADPLEVYSLDFDTQYKEEEAVMRDIDGYVSRSIYLLPRQPGDALPEELRLRSKRSQKWAELEAKRREEEERKRLVQEALESCRQAMSATKAALTGAIGSPLTTQVLLETIGRPARIGKAHASALVGQLESEPGAGVSAETVIEAIDSEEPGVTFDDSQDGKAEVKAVGEIQDAASGAPAEKPPVQCRNVLIYGGPLSGKSALATALSERLQVPLVTLDKVVEYFLSIPDADEEALSGEADPNGRLRDRIDVKQQILLQMEGKADPISGSGNADGDGDAAEAGSAGDEPSAEPSAEPEGKHDGEEAGETGPIDDEKQPETGASADGPVDHGTVDDGLINTDLFVRALKTYLQLSPEELGEPGQGDDVNADADADADAATPTRFAFGKGIVIDDLSCKYLESNEASAEAVYRAFDAVRATIDAEKDPDPNAVALKAIVTPDPHVDVAMEGEAAAGDANDKGSAENSARLAVISIKAKWLLISQRATQVKESLQRIVDNADTKELLADFEKLPDAAVQKLKADKREDYDAKLAAFEAREKAAAELKQFPERLAALTTFYAGPAEEDDDEGGDEDSGDDAKKANPYDDLLMNLEPLGRKAPIQRKMSNLGLVEVDAKYKDMASDRRKGLSPEELKRLKNMRRSLFRSKRNAGDQLVLQGNIPWIRMREVRALLSTRPSDLADAVEDALRPKFSPVAVDGKVIPDPVTVQAFMQPPAEPSFRPRIANFAIALRSAEGKVSGAADADAADAKAGGAQPKKAAKGKKAAAAAEPAEADEKSDEKQPRQRWVIPAGGSIQINVTFTSAHQGKFTSQLGFKVTGSPNEYSLLCSGVCAVPEIASDARSVFMRRIKTQRRNAILRKQFVLDKRVFVFGPLLVGKDPSSRESKDEEALATVRATNAEAFRITNTGIFDCQVNFSLLGQADEEKRAFYVDPPSLELAPDEMKEVTVWAFPKEAEEYSDTLVCSITDNPIPVTFDVSCEGSAPKLELSAEEIVFPRLLVGQVSSKTVVLKNPGKLPISWEVKDPADLEEFGAFFSVLPARTGEMRPLSSTTLTIEFEAKEERKLETELKVEFRDVEKIFETETRSLRLDAEAFAMSVRPEWPEGTEGLHFGTLKVNQPALREFSLYNEGKYPVQFQFDINPRKKRFYSEVLKIEPLSGEIVAGEKQEFKVFAQSKREVEFSNQSDIKLLVNEPQTKDRNPALPIRVHFKSVFSKFRVLPAHGTDFGPLETGTRVEKQVEIYNDGVFDFEYQIFESGTEGVTPLQEVFPEPTVHDAKGKGDGKASGASTEELELGAFKLTGVTGVVPAGDKVVVTIEFKADDIKEYGRTLEIDICQRDKLQSRRILYELMGEGCSPGIITNDFSAIFEEQTVVKRLDPGQPVLTNTFTIEEPGRTFHFAPVLANSKGKPPSERFRVANPFKVPCNVTIKVEAKGGSEDAKEGPQPAFSVTPAALHIPAHEHRFVTVKFTPQGLSTCRAVFTAEVERCTIEDSKRLSFEITGEGILPSVSVESPSQRDPETSAVLLQFPRTSLLHDGRPRKVVTQTIQLRNDQIIPATARFDVTDAEAFRFSGRGRLVELQPGQNATLTVSYVPRSVGESDARISMRVLQNPFENFTFRLRGECFAQDVTMEGLDVNPDSKLEEMRFGDVAVDEASTKTFKMTNSSNQPYRFRWTFGEAAGDDAAATAPFKFSPAVGHLQPGQSKEVAVTFSSAESKEFKGEDAKCEILKIRYVAPGTGVGEEGAGEGKDTDNGAEPKPAPQVADWDDTLEDKEPSYQPAEDAKDGGDAADAGLSLPLSATADQCSYELDEAVESMKCNVKFAPTMMFQTRIFRFTMKNKSNIAMPYAWRLGDSKDAFEPETFAFGGGNDDVVEPLNSPVRAAAETKSLSMWQIRGMDADDATTFSVTPSNGQIEPMQDQIFTVKFAPMGCRDFSRVLGGCIKNLNKELAQPRIRISGAGRRPKCHFELEGSDYLQAGRRPADMPDMYGRLGALDASTYQVIEFKSLGTHVRNTRKFYVVNPTGSDYDYEWVYEGVSMRGQGGSLGPSGGAVVNPFSCLSRKGTVKSGRKAEMVFEFTPRFDKLVESVWKFKIPDQGIEISVLIVGRIAEPDVTLDRTHINFKHLLLGTRKRDVIYLVNNENMPFAFNINFEQDTKSLPVLDIKPASGVVPAEGRLPLNIMFRPRAEVEYNFNVNFDIKKKPGKTSLNIKGQGYKVLSQLEVDDTSISGETVRVMLEPDGINRVDFGVCNVSERRIKRLYLSNAGKFPFDYQWKLGGAGFLSATPAIGKVHKGDSATINLVFQAEREVSFGDLLSYLQIGPKKYTLSLSGRAKKPRLHFSFQRCNFGPRFLSQEGEPSAARTLRVVNNETVNIEVDVQFPARAHLSVEGNATVLAPGESAEFPIKFYPLEIRKYHEEILFEINGTYKVPVVVTGEGVPLRVSLVKETDRLVNLGEIRSGQQFVRQVQVVNRSRISAQFRLGVPDAVMTRLIKLHGIRGDAKEDPEAEARLMELRENPLAKRLEQFCLSYHPASVITLRPRQTANIEFVYHPDKTMPKFREDVMINVVSQPPQKLLTVTGACFGVGVTMDTNSVPFGAIVKNTRLVKTVRLSNTGEAGIRFQWNPRNAAPNFTISPVQGFVPPKESMNIEVTFHPSELDNDIRVAKIPCLIDRQQHPNMYLTLTGACVPPRSDSKELSFAGPVRKVQKQTVTIENPTSSEWDDIKAQISNDYWFGPASIRVPAKGKTTYEISYKPLSMTSVGDAGGDADVKSADAGATPSPKASDKRFSRPEAHEGSLFFALPNGEAVLYKLVGTASEPEPEKRLEVKCKCKRTEIQPLVVGNWLSAPQQFKVDIDVKVEGGDDDSKTKRTVQVMGPKSLDVPGLADREYRLKFFAYKEGKTEVVVTFLNPRTRESVKYEVVFTTESVQSKRLPLLETNVRKKRIFTEEIVNPLDEPATIESFECEDPGVFVKTPTTIPARGSARVKICYNPLVPSEKKDGVKLSIHCAELGEFAYALSLSATDVGTSNVLRFNTDLGSRAVLTYRFRSFATTDDDAEYTCEIKGAEFTVQDTVKAELAQPGSDGVETTIDVAYEPSNLGGVRDTLVLKSKGKAGTYKVALVGLCEKPKRKGPVEIKNGGSAQISFKNVLSESAEFVFSINNPAFTIGNATETIGSKETKSITVSYKGEGQGGFDVGNLLIICKKMKHPWVYYIRGSK